MFLHTLKEEPRDAEIASIRLMLRASMVKKLASGIYSYLPFGLKALRKVEAIVREEMNAAGAQEVLMPAVQPAEIWKESGRWDFYGKELLRFTDRKNAEFAFGPTHEEVITTIVRDEVHSYRDLPINLYQIQTKFRDEIRPRFGVIRSREFIMKDAYSFDVDEQGAEKSYQAMYQAYERIFRRCGLKFKTVEADSGPIGGNFSHEFMVLASTGEDVILSCSACGYAANLEKAEIAKPASLAFPEAPAGSPEKVHTPNVRTIDEVCSFLGVTPQELVKTLIYSTESGVIAALVRGDHEVNEVKLKRAAGVETLELADEPTIEKHTKAPRGFAGPMGLTIKTFADYGLLGMGACVTGGNEEDYHAKNVWLSRDAKIDVVADIRNAEAGDPCPRCSEGALEAIHGIEVGHIFKLGTKYSKAMNANILNENGELKPIIMGCYGIGVTRVLAAAIEQSNDEHGIVFPVPIAPYQVIVVPVSTTEDEVRDTAFRMYEELQGAGVDALIDDRDLRPGVRFMDADLIGIPYRITVGARGLKEGIVEVKERSTGTVEKVPVGEAVRFCLDKLKQ
jgi:prolyl-tRNA synthetase